MSRGFISEAEDPVLHTSSYETDQALLRQHPELADEPPRRLKKLGYKAQCSTVMAHVASLIEMWHQTGTSAIVEGVHLHLKTVSRLMAQYSSVLPFLVRICALLGCFNCIDLPLLVVLVHCGNAFCADASTGPTID